MGNDLSMHHQFIAEIAEYYPALYHSNQRLNDDAKNGARVHIALLAAYADFPAITENVVAQLMQFLKSRYIYAQCRVHASFLLDGMTTQTLKIVVACHYLQHHTAHRRFVNINISDMARLVLEERDDPFIHLRAIDRIRHLLPVQPAPAVNEVNDQVFQVPEHILVLPVQLEVNEEVEGEEHPVQHFPLPQRRAADYEEVIEVVDLIDDDDD